MKIKLVVVGGVDEFHIVATREELVAVYDGDQEACDPILTALDAAYGEGCW